MIEEYKRLSGESDFEYGLRLIKIKVEDKPDNLEWADMVSLLDLNIHYDTLRKAVQAPFGGYKVLKYFENKKVESVTDSGILDEIRDVIGALDVKKQEVRTKTSELKRIKKDLVKSVEISNDIKDEMFKNGFSVTVPDYCNDIIEIYSDNKMIVNISDWHIGYVIHNCKGNRYNTEIAQRRIEKLTQEIEKYCRLYNINKIYVVNTGDTIEHTYMRGNQSTNTELNQSQQINKSIRLIYDFLVSLNKFADVSYYSIAGNHDRSMGDKSISQDGDNANVVISEQLYNWNELAENKRLKIVLTDYLEREIVLEINGVKCKFLHGDEKLKDGRSLLQTEMSMDEEFYNIIFKGHYHNYSVTSENRGRCIVTTGCLSGFNDYSARFGAATNASQTICIIGDNEIELIKGVDLQVN